MTLLQRIAQSGRKAAVIMKHASPFVFEPASGRTPAHFVAAIAVGHDASAAVAYPVYTRMKGDLESFFDTFGETLRVDDVLNILMSTLHMLTAMKAVHAHHNDVKEANILYNLDCPRGLDPYHNWSRCHAKFALSDFGLVMFDADADASSGMYDGTGGYMSPLMYDRFADFSSRHFAEHLFPAKKVWASYYGNAQPTRKQVMEKNDLYAVGVMLLFFDYDSDRTGRAKRIRRLAERLVLGRGGIWSVEDAIDEYRSVRQAVGAAGGRTPLPSIFELPQSTQSTHTPPVSTRNAGFGTRATAPAVHAISSSSMVKNKGRRRSLP